MKDDRSWFGIPLLFLWWSTPLSTLISWIEVVILPTCWIGCESWRFDIFIFTDGTAIDGDDGSGFDLALLSWWVTPLLLKIVIFVVVEGRTLYSFVCGGLRNPLILPVAVILFAVIIGIDPRIVLVCLYRLLSLIKALFQATTFEHLNFFIDLLNYLEILCQLALMPIFYF
jgi:hypothetical protein